jgi:SAM-dependent methyltransferase
VLDIGTGTGFAAGIVRDRLGDRLAELVCVDLSPDMLVECRTNVTASGRSGTRFLFTCGPLESIAMAPRFDLVITNALLHHLLDVPAFLTQLGQLLQPGGFYVAGHEPHAAYYRHPVLQRAMRLYRTTRRMARLFQPRRLARRIRLTPVPPSLEAQTNQALIAQGAIRRPLPPGAISRLVDIHVPPPDPADPFWGEPGLDPKRVADLAGLELAVVLTYSHIKDARSRMFWGWRRVSDMLAGRYPLAGADFILAARRSASAMNRSTTASMPPVSPVRRPAAGHRDPSAE